MQNDKRVRVGAFDQRNGGVDCNLVGERRERREDSRAAHDDPVRSVGDFVQCDLVARRRHVALGLVDSRMNYGVGQRDVAAREELLIRDEIRRATLVAADSPLFGAAREARERDIHIVWRAAHQADGELGDSLQACVTALEVGARARNHVAQVDRLAGLGIRHQADVARLMLQVEDLRHRIRRAGEGGMRHDVADLVIADPQLARLRQAFEKFASGACSHWRSPRRSTTRVDLTGRSSPAGRFVKRASREFRTGLFANSQRGG